PAVKIFDKGQINAALVEVMKVNSRLPDFLQGDMWAGISAARLGERRIQEIVAKYGQAAFFDAMEDFLDYGEQQVLRGLAKPPKGEFRHEGLQDSGDTWKIR